MTVLWQIVRNTILIRAPLPNACLSDRVVEFWRRRSRNHQRITDMACSPEVLKQVPLFGLLDDEEIAVLAAQVEVKNFGARQRIYKMGDTQKQGYVLISGSVPVSTVDQDNREVIVDQPGPGEFFGFAAMLGQTPHRTDAVASQECACIEIDRGDILT